MLFSFTPHLINYFFIRRKRQNISTFYIVYHWYDIFDRFVIVLSNWLKYIVHQVNNLLICLSFLIFNSYQFFLGKITLMYLNFHFNYKFDPQFWEIQCNTLIFRKIIRLDTLTTWKSENVLNIFILVLLAGIWAYVFLNVRVSHCIFQNWRSNL